MDQEAYIKERLDDQINWYDKKSKRSQNWFKYLRVIEIIAAATIPFLAGYISDTTLHLKLLVGFLGVVIAVIASIISLNKFQEIWIQYRTTCETLRHHKYLYITKSEPYDGEDAFHMLVETVESLISKEHSKWSEFTKKVEKVKRNG